MITQMPSVWAVVPAVPPNRLADVYLNFPFYIAMCHWTVGSLLGVMDHFLRSLAKNVLDGESWDRGTKKLGRCLMSSQVWQH